jgi:hypothetical protein
MDEGALTSRPGRCAEREAGRNSPFIGKEFGESGDKVYEMTRIRGEGHPVREISRNSNFVILVRPDSKNAIAER